MRALRCAWRGRVAALMRWERGVKFVAAAVGIAGEVGRDGGGLCRDLRGRRCSVIVYRIGYRERIG